MAGKGLEGLRILLVEDDPIIALGVAQSLRDAGAVVIGPAHTVAKALHIIRDGAIDAAVLDYRLESETASPVAQRLSDLDVPFLFHTSSRGAFEQDHPRAPVIDKPTSSAQLVAAIKALTFKP